VWRRKSGRAIGSGEDGITKARALLLQPVEQPPRPDEFRGQNAEAHKNRQPAGEWREEHDDAKRKQREAKNDSEDSLGLLESPDHLFSGFLSASIAILIRDRASYCV
jgi:hypothetical protein